MPYNKQASLPDNVSVIKRRSEGLHKNNCHKGKYVFPRLINALPELAQKVIRNPKGEATIRFDDPDSVLLLNRALLAEYYHIRHWSIPKGFLCPPLPGRADYVHRVADLLYRDFPDGRDHVVKVLDIGTGANGIYPIVGTVAYGWRFKASDIDPVSVNNVTRLVADNPVLHDHVVPILQMDRNRIFKGVIAPDERFHMTLCNPPFHHSLQEALQGSRRKRDNLQSNRAKRNGTPVAFNPSEPTLNFGGQKAELWCPGGELGFIRRLAEESRQFKGQVMWFSTLVSKKENVRPLQKQLERMGVDTIHIEQMSHGQKISRFVAWTWHSAVQRQTWAKESSGD